MTSSRLKADGVRTSDTYFKERPELVKQALTTVKILDVNQETVRSFGFQSKEEMLGNLSDNFRESVLETFRLELVAIANGDDSLKIESPAVLKNGLTVNTLVFMSIPKEREQFKEIIIAHIDINELKNTQSALETAKIESRRGKQGQE